MIYWSELRGGTSTHKIKSIDEIAWIFFLYRRVKEHFVSFLDILLRKYFEKKKKRSGWRWWRKHFKNHFNLMLQLTFIALIHCELCLLMRTHFQVFFFFFRNHQVFLLYWEFVQCISALFNKWPEKWIFLRLNRSALTLRLNRLKNQYNDTLP